MRTATKLMLGLLGGRRNAITYLFRDEFTTDATAPLTSPRTAEPGPGTLTITDTGNLLSVSSGALTASAAATTYGDPGIYTGAIARTAGLVFRTRMLVPGAFGANHHLSVGWLTAKTFAFPPYNYLASGIVHGGSGGYLINNGPAIGAWELDAWHTFDFVLLSAGAAMFLDSALLWIDHLDSTATVYAGIGPRQVGFRTFHADYFRVRALPAPFNTDHGIATLNVASPADATEYTGDADAIIDLTVTAPGVLDGLATTRCGFYYRADADLSPAWHCYVDGTGAFNVDSIDAAGTRTNRITAAGVIAGGATRTLRVICAGTKHNAYSLSGTTWTKRGAEVTLSLNDAVTTIEPSIPAGWSAADLRCYPRTSSAYAELDRT